MSFTPDTTVLGRCQQPSIESMILGSRLCWFGHLVRMDDYGIHKQLLYGETSIGKRRQRKTSLRLKDVSKSL